MFNNNRYMTIGVKNSIPLDLQLLMWNCIDKLKEQGKEIDYLQVFELTKERIDDIFFQRIEHRQEVPEYKKTYKVFPKEMVNTKVFVIDDVMLAVIFLPLKYKNL